jgi:hypothetical protein
VAEGGAAPSDYRGAKAAPPSATRGPHARYDDAPARSFIRTGMVFGPPTKLA